MPTRSANSRYRCVNCGAPAEALFKTYGPAVLKLKKCDICKELVDKYIECDPVIVMIDLLLMSREAQRHVLYNIEFKSYWKLFIILMMLETYGMWRNENLFNFVVNNMCGFKNNSTVNTTRLGIPETNIEIPESWKSNCWAFDLEERGDDSDLFIWEKDFYIKFITTFSGIVAFILLVNNYMRIMNTFFVMNEVSLPRLLKGFAIANANILFSLPMLVWGYETTSPETRAAHAGIVYVYGLVMFSGVFAVMYECPAAAAAPGLVVASLAKHVTCYHVLPYLRHFVT